MNLVTRALLALAAALCAVAALAGPGHEHDHGPSPAAGQASPRFEARSDLFELVGIVDGDALVLYLDRFETNEPVTAATLEIELLAAGNAPLTAVLTAQADGTYVFKSERWRNPGEYAFQIGVTAGQDVDILAGNLTIAAPADVSAGSAGVRSGWLAAGAAALLALVLAAARWRRRRVMGAAA